MSLANYQALVADKVRDQETVISNSQRDQAIELAVLRYSEDRPRVLVQDLASAGGYRLPLPASWHDGISVVRMLEYPIGNIPATTLAPDSISFYRSPPSTVEIELRQSLPAAAQVRCTYTARHLVDAGNDTTPAQHVDAIASLAASHLCEQIANHYANEGSSTINADVVNHQSKSQTYASRARRLRDAYTAAIGSRDERAAPASASVSVPSLDSFGNRRIFHPPAGLR